MVKCAHGGHGRPLEEREGTAGHLSSGSCALLLALGQRDQCAQTDGVRKDPTEPAQPDIELGWLRGANGKEACSLSEDLELLPECEEGSEKGWSRRVSCVDSSIGV